MLPIWLRPVKKTVQSVQQIAVSVQQTALYIIVPMNTHSIYPADHAGSDMLGSSEHMTVHKPDGISPMVTRASGCLQQSQALKLDSLLTHDQHHPSINKTGRFVASVATRYAQVSVHKIMCRCLGAVLEVSVPCLLPLQCMMLVSC